MRLLKNRLRRVVSRQLLDRIRVTDYASFYSQPGKGKALLSYLPYPLLLPERARSRKRFSNQGIAEELPRALNELGYIVDVISFQNRYWRPNAPYDLFLGHPGSNFVRLAESVGESCVKLLFVTGTYWREANRRVLRRSEELGKRRGKILESPRLVEHEEDSALRLADGVICIGNDDTAATYPPDLSVLTVPNAVYPPDWTRWRYRDYETARRNFLFFAGPGPVLKGLDLVVEAFLESPHVLHVCQREHSDFLRIYEDVLSNAPNIRFYGEIPMRGDLFRDLAERCAWVVSATAAEGQPGALLECMAHGMIPIVPRSAHVGTDGLLLMPSVDVPTIRSHIDSAAETSPEVCALMAEDVWQRALDEHSVPTFRTALRSAVAGLLERHESRVP